MTSVTSATNATTAPPAGQREWHGMSAEEVRRDLAVDPAIGLSAAEVTKRRATSGANKLAEEAKEPGWRAFLRQYEDLMQIVLLVAALVSIIALKDIGTGVVVIA